MPQIRLKDCFVNNGHNLSDKFVGDILYVDIGSVSYEKGIINKELINFKDAPSRARKKVKNNDIIISTVRTYLKSIVKIENPETNLIVSTGFAVLTPKPNFEPKFLEYLVKSEGVQNLIFQNSKGVSYPSINQQELLAIEVESYPFDKQKDIAKYLTAEISKIDKKISILQKKFDKLEEYKQSIIFETVTQGLDKKFPVKDSGIEWIEQIPTHWDMKKLKDIANIQKGIQFQDNMSSPDGIYPYINGGIKPSDWSNHFNTQEDTIAVSEGGASAGYVQYMKTKYWAGAHCYKINSRNKNNIKYLYYILKGFENHLMIEKTGSAMPNLQKSRFINFTISFVKNQDEQEKIVKYLDGETSRIDKKKEIIKKQIGLLKEYKKSIIYEAVTGKIAV